MFFFFVAAAVFAVLFVFDSPAIDYRFVALGGVLPLLESVTGRPLILHTLLGSVALMTIVMAVTVGRRVLRRRLLGIPIGTFVFLVASGAWTRSGLFWWPALGFDGLGERPLPEFDRAAPVLALLELAGIGAIIWLVYRFELRRPDHREQLVRTGRLPRSHMA
ncbi:MAG: hypothetical protein AAF548_03260 [Actinomycetota bacterium]